jgi:hypothetical protein
MARARAATLVTRTETPQQRRNSTTGTRNGRRDSHCCLAARRGFAACTAVARMCFFLPFDVRAGDVRVVDERALFATGTIYIRCRRREHAAGSGQKERCCCHHPRAARSSTAGVARAAYRSRARRVSLYYMYGVYVHARARYTLMLERTLFGLNLGTCTVLHVLATYRYVRDRGCMAGARVALRAAAPASSASPPPPRPGLRILL